MATREAVVRLRATLLNHIPGDIYGSQSLLAEVLLAAESARTAWLPPCRRTGAEQFRTVMMQCLPGLARHHSRYDAMHETRHQYQRGVRHHSSFCT